MYVISSKTFYKGSSQEKLKRPSLYIEKAHGTILQESNNVMPNNITKSSYKLIADIKCHLPLLCKCPKDSAPSLANQIEKHTSSATCHKSPTFHRVTHDRSFQKWHLLTWLLCHSVSVVLI